MATIPEQLQSILDSLAIIEAHYQSTSADVQASTSKGLEHIDNSLDLLATMVEEGQVQP